MASKKYDNSRKINIKCENMYGANFYSDVIKKGENQILSFLLEFSQEYVSPEEAIDFLSEIILNPLLEKLEKLEELQELQELEEHISFSTNYFNIAKSQLAQNINSRLSDKKELAKNICIEKMCPNEKFSIYADGYLEDLSDSKVNPRNLYLHYEQLILNANANIIVIGDINNNTNLKNYISNKFSKLNINNNINNNYLKQSIKQPLFIKENFDVTQGKLCMGFRTNIFPQSSQYFDLLLANEILGGGASSKLFKNIREKQSLCYYINSFVYIFKGIVFIQSGVDEYEKVIKCIQDEVEDIKNGNFDDLDIQNAKFSLSKKYKSIEDSNTSLMDFYFTNYLINNNNNIKNIQNKITNISKLDIQKSFQNIYLDTCYFMQSEK